MVLKTNSTQFDFKHVWKSDVVAGFLVFLLALPLSLGIAKASGFPAAMGVLAAIVGGLVTSFFRVSPLTIKGPAAGLITICSAAMIDFGGGEQAWQTVAAALTVAAVFQIVFGFLRFGVLSDIFPHSAVHGMLAAIGIIIIVKQVPVLLGDEPAMYAEKSPFELMGNIPQEIAEANPTIAFIGLFSLAIMFVFPLIKIAALKKIPAPLLVLLLMIPLASYWRFKESQPAYALVEIGDFWGQLNLNVNYASISTWIFWKYVLMLLFVNSLESLLTVKATDALDSFGRKSDYDADLKGLGVGNFVSGLLGGLPLISEVVRSTSNITYGAKSKWSNFFHGVFLLIAMLFFIPVIEMIPNAALAAMLVYAGYRLAAPKHFIAIWKVGREQMAIFFTTIVVTLAFDLLLGIFSGVLVKFIFHILHGVSLKRLIFAKVSFKREGNDSIRVHINEAAIFSHLLLAKRVFDKLPKQKNIILDFSSCTIVDHSFLELVDYFKNDYEQNDGTVSFVGLEQLTPISKHPLATRRLLRS